MAEINSTTSLTKPKSNAELAAEIKAAHVKIEGSKAVKVSIPSILQAQLGSNLYVAVNGIHIYVPVDGEEHAIPEPLALVVKQMLKDLK